MEPMKILSIFNYTLNYQYKFHNFIHLKECFRNEFNSKIKNLFCKKKIHKGIEFLPQTLIFLSLYLAHCVSVVYRQVPTVER